MAGSAGHRADRRILQEQISYRRFAEDL